MLFIDEEFIIHDRRYRIQIGESDFGRHWGYLSYWRTFQKRKKGKLRTMSEWSSIVVLKQGSCEFDRLVPPMGGPWAPLVQYLKDAAKAHAETESPSP